ncbi:uncharacterized protein LOC108475682 [Gossypium arboreum]|uniref:Uncharacterized protein n=1 Tax=Gossypium arboreum TaxID=29729 RepID=A0ABR0QJ08_GOSAR|nr:uncharacterized protein LOC108475682 [Gossypium arboreum]KAK5838967.1 hypothetical protein PVK06_007717 [Gossypium arboreum]
MVLLQSPPKGTGGLEVGTVAAGGWVYGGIVVGEVAGGDDVIRELAGVEDGGDDERDFEGDVDVGAEEVMGGFIGETTGVVVGVDFGDGNNPKKDVVLGYFF